MTHASSIRKPFALVGIILLAGLAANPASARTTRTDPRDFQALGNQFLDQQHQGAWRKANGAEIMGGFAGPDDLVNIYSGEVRSSH